MSIWNPAGSSANDEPPSDSQLQSERNLSLGNTPKQVEYLVGQRVQIRALKELGSARLLNGLTGTVVSPHPIVTGWVKLNLDANSITPYQDWSVAIDRLVLLDAPPLIAA